MSDVYHGVAVEAVLQPLSGVSFHCARFIVTCKRKPQDAQFITWSTVKPWPHMHLADKYNAILKATLWKEKPYSSMGNTTIVVKQEKLPIPADIPVRF